MPRHIVALSHALAPVADITVVSEPDRGGFLGLEGRHIALPGLASSLRPGAVWQGYQALMDALRTEEADLVWLHARLPVILGRLGAIRQAYKGRVSVTFHGLPFGPGHRRVMALLSRRLERWMARRTPPLEMVFLTEDQRDAMSAHLGCAGARHRLWVLGNASTIGPLPAPRQRGAGRHLVMTGRAGWQKNLEAAAAILPNLPEDTELSLCGPGTNDAGFAAKLRVIAGRARSRLHLLGPINDVGALLAAADGYLLTSRYEGEPIGALEAWEAGLPVFLADFPGARNLAKHPFSQVFSSEDPASRAREIDAGLDAFLGDKSRHAQDIRASWAKHHAPEIFATNARRLVETWLAAGA
ncbi:MAG: glycosyltransferase [Pseudomonadota bacterium]